MLTNVYSLMHLNTSPIYNLITNFILRALYWILTTCYAGFSIFKVKIQRSVSETVLFNLLVDHSQKDPLIAQLPVNNEFIMGTTI